MGRRFVNEKWKQLTTHVQLGQGGSRGACEWRNVANVVDGSVESGGSAGRTGKMSGGNAHRREGRIEADGGQVSIGVGLVGEMRPVFHGWGVTAAHPYGLIEVKGWIERSGDIDGCGRLGELVGCLGEKMVL